MSQCNPCIYCTPVLIDKNTLLHCKYTINACTDPACVHATVVDEVVRDALGGPRELGETRVNLLVEELDALAKQAALLLRQRRDDSAKQIHVTC